MAEIPWGVYLRFYDDFDNAVEVGSTCFVLPGIVVKLSQRFVVDSRAGMQSRGATVLADCVPVS